MYLTFVSGLAVFSAPRVQVFFSEIFLFDSVRLAMKVIEYALASQDTKLAEAQAAAKVPTAEQYKVATRSAIRALDLFTHYEKVGLISEIEDAWSRLEAG